MESLPPGPSAARDSHSAATPHSAAPLAAPRSPRPSILYGQEGLRAGWSALLYVGVLISLLFLSSYELRWFAMRLHQSVSSMRGGEMHPTLLIVSEATTLLAVLIATIGMARLEQRPAAYYGLMGADRLRQFVLGLLSGFGFLSLLVGILVATHHLALDRTTIPLHQTLTYAAAWGLCFLLVALTEELMVRGYLLFTLARGITFWPAAILLAALFGLLHTGNSGESHFGLLAAGLVALVFSLSLWRLGHLWWAIGFHAAWDWAESFFYGTPDSGTVSVGRLLHAQPLGATIWSGGPTGPEGSVWIVPVLVLAALFVWFTQSKQDVRF